jgi:hypothetical protein
LLPFWFGIFGDVGEGGWGFCLVLFCSVLFYFIWFWREWGWGNYIDVVGGAAVNADALGSDMGCGADVNYY